MSGAYVIPPPPRPSLPVLGTTARFPVRRIFCIGRNYADHAREMGAPEQADGREPPFFFMKPADALISGEGELQLPYPPQTRELHHELELVVALAAGGRNLSRAAAQACLYAYAVGLDLTRRDLQAKAKAKGHPWDLSKGFDASAVLSPLLPAGQAGPEVPARGRIWLTVNGELRQNGDLAQMGWDVPEILVQLSRSVSLAAGDLIYTGTPAGVGPLSPGDCGRGGIDGVGELAFRILAPE